MTLELCPPKDIAACAKAMAEWLDNRTRLFVRAGPATVEIELDWYRDKAKEEGQINWSIYADGKFIGNCGMHDIDHTHRSAELGILIADKKYWGKGIAAVAEVAMVEYAFDGLCAGGLNKIVAYVYVSRRGDGNEASRAALRKVGFRDVGLL